MGDCDFNPDSREVSRERPTTARGTTKAQPGKAVCWLQADRHLHEAAEVERLRGSRVPDLPAVLVRLEPLLPLELRATDVVIEEPELDGVDLRGVRGEVRGGVRELGLIGFGGQVGHAAYCTGQEYIGAPAQMPPVGMACAAAGELVSITSTVVTNVPYVSFKTTLDYGCQVPWWSNPVMSSGSPLLHLGAANALSAPLQFVP